MSYVSDNTKNKKKELDALEAAKPEEYKSQHQSTIDSLLDQIANRKQFSYDFDADPLYQQYKDNYIQQGNQAMMNTMANAATLTGGFGNSYATSAGAQANQQYLGQLNNVIPELYAAAMNKYNMDTDALMNSYSVTTDAESRDYSKYVDALANYNANKEYLYGQYLDSIGQDQYKEQFDYQKLQDEKAYNQWLEEFNYQKAQDEQAYQQWLMQFNYQKEQDALAAAQAVKAAQTTKAAQTNQTEEEATNVVMAPVKEKQTTNTSINRLDTFMQVSKVAEKKASVSSETLADYLASQVNSGRISEFDADRIYAQYVK